MKKFYFLIVILLIGTADISAQTRKNIFGGFLGNAPLGSVNYDSRLSAVSDAGIGYSVGLSGGYSYYYSAGSLSLGLPVALNYLVGSRQHFLELGLSGTPEFMLRKSDNPADRGKPFFFNSHFNLGYRYQTTKEKGIMFNVLWTPLISFKGAGFYRDNKKYLYNFGLGVGYSFK